MVQNTAYDYIIRYPQKQNDAQFAIELGTGTPMWLPPSVGYDDVKGVESDNIQIFLLGKMLLFDFCTVRLRYEYIETFTQWT